MSCMHSLYIFYINSLLDRLFTNILSHWADCLFIWLTSFLHFLVCLQKKQKKACKNFLVWYNPTSLFLLSVPLPVCVSRSLVSDSVTSWTPLSMEFSRQDNWSGLPFPYLWRHPKILLILMSKSILLTFSSRRLMAFDLSFKSLIHLSLFLFVMLESSPVWLFCIKTVQFSQKYLLKRLFPIIYSYILCCRLTAHISVNSFLGPPFLFHWPIYLSLCQCHTV